MKTATLSAASGRRHTQGETGIATCRLQLYDLITYMAVLSGLLAALAGPVLADGAVPTTPQATIRAVTDGALAALRAHRDALQKNPVEVAALVARVVDPYLDFALISEEALGAAWRRADDRQRARFSQAFRQLLTNDYAVVLKQYSGQTVRITGVRWEDAGHSRALVLSRVEGPGEQPIEVDYRMYHTGGRWKVYDVVVEGTSLLINYRETFAAELQKESLDTLISQIVNKVAANQASAPR
jgi:phospholipid transport system substrate-binding protein